MLIKICGVRDAKIAYETAKFGTDFIGVVFEKTSSRYVEPLSAQPIVDAIKLGGARAVAIFTYHTAREMVGICKENKISVAQLHGESSRLSHHALPDDVIRFFVIPIGKDGLPSITYSLEGLEKNRDYLLFDGLKGGGGKKIKTAFLAEQAQGFPFFLASGLHADNVQEAMLACSPNGVDVSSGVESRPGYKCMQKIQQFINVVRNCPSVFARRTER